MLEELKTKLKDLDVQLEQGAANINFLRGAKAAFEQLYNDQLAASKIDAVEEVVAAE